MNNNKSYKCHLCEKKFPTPNGLNVHLAQYHTADERKTKFACRFCTQGSNNKAGMVQHECKHQEAGGLGFKSRSRSRSQQKAIINVPGAEEIEILLPPHPKTTRNAKNGMNFNVNGNGKRAENESNAKNVENGSTNNAMNAKNTSTNINSKADTNTSANAKGNYAKRTNPTDDSSAGPRDPSRLDFYPRGSRLNFWQSPNPPKRQQMEMESSSNTNNPQQLNNMTWAPSNPTWYLELERQAQKQRENPAAMVGNVGRKALPSAAVPQQHAADGGIDTTLQQQQKQQEPPPQPKQQQEIDAGEEIMVLARAEGTRGANKKAAGHNAEDDTAGDDERIEEDDEQPPAAGAEEGHDDQIKRAKLRYYISQAALADVQRVESQLRVQKLRMQIEQMKQRVSQQPVGQPTAAIGKMTQKKA